MNILEKTYSVTEASRILGQSREAVHKYIRQGKLKSQRQAHMLRIRQADLYEFLKAETAPISAKPQLRK